MNRNNLLIGAAIVAVVVGGVFLGQRLRNRSLPDAAMTQATPTPTTGTVANPISGKPQVRITVANKGTLEVELDPNSNMEAVANFLGKWSRGECDNQTLSQCGITIKSDGTVTDSLGNIIGKVIGPTELSLSSEDQISSTLILSK